VRDKGNQAFHRLLRDHYDEVYRYLYRMTGRREEAEDLVQETFCRTYRYLAGGGGVRHPRTWLFRVASNVLHDHWAWRRCERSAGGRIQGPAAQVSDEMAGADLRIDLRAALASLNPDHRAALVLRYYHDLRLGDIARITCVPPGTVKSRLHYALLRLRERLEEKGGDACGSAG